MQRNAEKCREMQRNAEKCREMLRNAEIPTRASDKANNRNGRKNLPCHQKQYCLIFERCRGTKYSRTFGSDITNRFPVFSSNHLPALMAKGSISPDTALVQSTLFLASFSKTFLPQTITVLRTDGRVK